MCMYIYIYIYIYILEDLQRRDQVVHVEDAAVRHEQREDAIHLVALQQQLVLLLLLLVLSLS